MKKFTVLVGLLLIAFTAYAQPSQYALRNYSVQGPELNGAGYFANPETFIGRTFLNAIAADTYVVAVDKSSTRLKGSTVSAVDVRQLTVAAEVVSGTWNVKVGVVVKNNSTNGSIAWVDSIEWTATGAKSNVFWFPGGLRTAGLVSVATEYGDYGFADGFISNSTETVTALQNDAGDLNSPESAAVSAGAGDVVVLFKETDATAGGELRLIGITANYALH